MVRNAEAKDDAAGLLVRPVWFTYFCCVNSVFHLCTTSSVIITFVKYLLILPSLQI